METEEPSESDDGAAAGGANRGASTPARRGPAAPASQVGALAARCRGTARARVGPRDGAGTQRPTVRRVAARRRYSDAQLHWSPAISATEAADGIGNEVRRSDGQDRGERHVTDRDAR